MNCVQCQRPLKDVLRRYLKNSKYCSRICRTKFNSAKYHKMRKHALKMAPATRGCYSELFASLDLLGRGFEVFRALSAHCSCDLAILKDGVLKRIEVRTGYLLPSGRLSYPKADRDAGKQDIFAVVFDTEKGTQIRYFPFLDDPMRD